MVAGPNTFRLFTRMLAESTEESEVHEHGSLKCGVCRQPWCPPLLEESLDWPNATLVSGDAVRGGVDRCRRPGWGSGGDRAQNHPAKIKVLGVSELTLTGFRRANAAPTRPTTRS